MSLAFSIRVCFWQFPLAHLFTEHITQGFFFRNFETLALENFPVTTIIIMFITGSAVYFLLNDWKAWSIYQHCIFFKTMFSVLTVIDDSMKQLLKDTCHSAKNNMIDSQRTNLQRKQHKNGTQWNMWVKELFQLHKHILQWPSWKVCWPHSLTISLTFRFCNRY